LRVLAGYSDQGGISVATLGTAEKGYLDVQIEISTPGGHSGVPPTHTSIGYLSAILSHIESHPSEAHLSRISPVYEALQCIAAHSPNISRNFRKLVDKSSRDDKALEMVQKDILSGTNGRILKAILSTTQAVDIIEGGVKVNSLPMKATAIIDHRISTDRYWYSIPSCVLSQLTISLSSVSALTDRLIDFILPLAQQFNLSLTAFGRNITYPQSSAGSVKLSDFGNSALEPSPVTPTNTAAYKLLSGPYLNADLECLMPCIYLVSAQEPFRLHIRTGDIREIIPASS
jgi:Gly-Xaa carboxypeptidase